MENKGSSAGRVVRTESHGSHDEFARNGMGIAPIYHEKIFGLFTGVSFEFFDRSEATAEGPGPLYRVTYHEGLNIRRVTDGLWP